MKARYYMAVMVLIVSVIAFALFYYDPDPEAETEADPGLFWDEQEGEQQPPAEGPVEGDEEQEPGTRLEQAEPVPVITAGLRAEASYLSGLLHGTDLGNVC